MEGLSLNRWPIKSLYHYYRGTFLEIRVHFRKKKIYVRVRFFPGQKDPLNYRIPIRLVAVAVAAGFITSKYSGSLYR